MAENQKEEFVLLKEGYKVYTKTTGAGEIKLLTLHGGPGLTHECFANFPDYLNPEGVQVIFYDQLGSYFSDQPEDPSLWKMERFVDELHQVVQALHMENQFVFANSWGTMLLIDYLLKYNTPFRGIILSGMPASFQKFKENISMLRKTLPAEVLSRMEKHEQQRTTASPEYQQLLFENWFSRHYCLLKPWPDQLMLMLQHLVPVASVQLLGADIFNFDGPASSWDRTEELDQISVPALLITGKKDVAFEEDLRQMAGRMPDATYFVTSTGGHFCWWDDEKEFFRELKQFLHQRK